MSTVTRLFVRVAVAVTLSAVLFPPSAWAQNCSTVLLDHQDWIETQPNGAGTYTLSFVMVSNRLTRSAAYAEGGLALKYTPCSGRGFRERARTT